jgi:PIN domain nuclease of toxin-antitoxin system
MAQARSESLTILTADGRFSDYDVPTLDANT